MELGSKTIHSGESRCNFFELENTVLFEMLLGKREFVMIDMPEVMFRMKVASLYTLEQLKEIFNDLLNKIANAKQGEPRLPDVAALYYYPDVFLKPRDEYMAALLHEMANDTQYRKK